MALPSSGQISFNDVRTEMSQSSVTPYAFDGWAVGYYGVFDAPGQLYTPINVHTSNSGKYNTSLPLDMNTWHGYSSTLTYSPSATFENVDYSISPGSICYVSAMKIFDVGTTSGNISIQVSASLDEVGLTQYARIYYGKPWSSGGGDQISYWNATQVWGYDNTGSVGINDSFTYSYTYDANKGQNLYCVIYSVCP